MKVIYKITYSNSTVDTVLGITYKKMLFYSLETHAVVTITLSVLMEKQAGITNTRLSR